MSEERFKDIEATVKDLAEKVSHLDNSFTAMNVSIEDYVGWTKQLEKTIRHLDDTVREMGLQHEKIPLERVKDIRSEMNPVFNTLRRHEHEFIKKTDANVLVSISVFFISGIIILLGMFGNYVLGDMKTGILNAGVNNRSLIIKNTEAIKDCKDDTKGRLNGVRIYGGDK